VKVLPKKITVNTVPNYQIPLTPLEKDVKAKLSIKVLQAEGLENKNTLGALNPYVLLTSSGGTQDKKPDGKNNQQMRTKAVKVSGDNEAAWNEFFEFLITNEQTEKVTLQIMDPSDTGFSNDSVCGTMELSACEILQACENGSGWQEDWYQLLNCKSGRIKLAIEYGRCEPDEGPTDVDRVAKRKAGLAPPKFFDFGNIVIQVRKATGLPTSTLYGKPSSYVAIEYDSASGVATGRTSVVCYFRTSVVCYSIFFNIIVNLLI
jgi:Ca2+-dependent lipid-binding protein